MPSGSLDGIFFVWGHPVRAGPLALVRLPYRTPRCFHGNFFAA